MTNGIFISNLKLNYFVRCQGLKEIYKKDNKELFVERDGRNWIVRKGKNRIMKGTSQAVQEYLFGTGDMMFL